MDLYKEVLLEKDGLSETIIQYTNDNFIRSYANKMSLFQDTIDNEMFGLIVGKLLDWYKNELPKIEKNEYVVNKESHLKSYHLLERWHQMIVVEG